MRVLAAVLTLALAGPVLATDGVAQFYVVYSKDSGGNGNYKMYYAQMTGEWRPIVAPKLLIDSATAAHGSISNKGNRLTYVEQDAATGTYQLYLAYVDAAGSISAGPWRQTSDMRYSIQYPTITFDKRFGFTRTLAAGGPATEEVMVGTLHRKKKTILKWMKPATSNAVQDTQSFLHGAFKGIFYVRDGSIYFRPVNTNGPKGAEKVVLAANPPYATYGNPAVSKILRYVTYIKTDQWGNSNLYRIMIDAYATPIGAEEQMTFTTLPQKVVLGMCSSGLAQLMWVLDKGNGYQEIWRQWFYGNNPPVPVAAPALWVSGGYGDRFGRIYITEP
ncbi:MAG: hypothetical protein AB1714_22605 [Acidobacteriota bacterium]